MLGRVCQTPSPSFSLFFFMTEKTMANLPVDFRLFQFRSSTFASGKKDEFPRMDRGLFRSLSNTLRLPWALPPRFLFYLPAYLPIYTRLFVFLPHFASTSARIEKSSVETQKVCDIVAYRIAYVSTFETARKCMPIQHKYFPTEAA